MSSYWPPCWLAGHRYCCGCWHYCGCYIASSGVSIASESLSLRRRRTSYHLSFRATVRIALTSLAHLGHDCDPAGTASAPPRFACWPQFRERLAGPGSLHSFLVNEPIVKTSRCRPAGYCVHGPSQLTFADRINGVDCTQVSADWLTRRTNRNKYAYHPCHQWINKRGWLTKWLLQKVGL